MSDLEVWLVCRECGGRARTAGLAGRPSCARPGRVRGFRVEKVEVRFGGVCPACRAARGAEQA
ncbi:MAG TPA: hypothetical protein VFG87_05295 [Amycolatopsis sp.]|nr:hypothetical protein [Amycolatopsis sp.]